LKTPRTIMRDKLSVNEICAILEKCQVAGVRDFAFRGLRIKFGPPPIRVHGPQPPITFAAPDPDPLFQEKSILEQEQEVKEEELVTLQQEDPQLFDELVQSGDLINDERVLGSDDEVSGVGGGG